MEPRKMSELLQLVLNNNKYFITGLCSLVNLMGDNHFITEDEHSEVMDYIEDNPPESYLPGNMYYFTCYEWTPRERWLKEHIKLLQSEGR